LNKKIFTEYESSKGNSAKGLGKKGATHDENQMSNVFSINDLVGQDNSLIEDQIYLLTNVGSSKSPNDKQQV